MHFLDYFLKLFEVLQDPGFHIEKIFPTQKKCLGFSEINFDSHNVLNGEYLASTVQ